MPLRLPLVSHLVMQEAEGNLGRALLQCQRCAPLRLPLVSQSVTQEAEYDLGRWTFAMLALGALALLLRLPYGAAARPLQGSSIHRDARCRPLGLMMVTNHTR